MQRHDTLPHEVYYYGHPEPYIQPGQSRYHNLGFNGHLQIRPGMQWGGLYPGKYKGNIGDYGPRQTTPDQPGYAYPLDTDLHNTYHDSVNANKTTHFVGCNTPNERRYRNKK